MPGNFQICRYSFLFSNDSFPPDLHSKSPTKLVIRLSPLLQVQRTFLIIKPNFIPCSDREVL